MSLYDELILKTCTLVLHWMTQGNEHNFHQPLEKRWVSCETAEKSNTQTNMPGNSRWTVQTRLAGMIVEYLTTQAMYADFLQNYYSRVYSRNKVTSCLTMYLNLGSSRFQDCVEKPAN